MQVQVFLKEFHSLTPNEQGTYDVGGAYEHQFEACASDLNTDKDVLGLIKKYGVVSPTTRLDDIDFFRYSNEIIFHCYHTNRPIGQIASLPR